MPRQVVVDTSPEEIIEIAKEYLGILNTTKLKYSEDRIIADFKLRAAQLQTPPMTVDDWEKMWAAKKGAPPSLAQAPEPKKRPKKIEPEKTVEERVRGAAGVIDPAYFWMSPENLAIGRTWMALRKTGGVVMNLLAVGPSGCGKTEGLKRLATDADLPFYKVDCASITTSDKWVGHKEVNEQGTYYVLSEHLRWLSADGFKPGLLVYDEITRLHPTLLNILIPILDGSQSIWVPDLGIRVQVHPDTIIAATANIGTGFAGTFGLDVALHDRFGVLMEQTFPPEKEEIEILIRRTGIEQPKAKMLVTIAQQARAKTEQGDLSKPVSTRALIDAAWWVSTGMSVTEACEATFIKKYSDEGGTKSERMMVRVILKGVANGA